MKQFNFTTCERATGYRRTLTLEQLVEKSGKTEEQLEVEFERWGSVMFREATPDMRAIVETRVERFEKDEEDDEDEDALFDEIDKERDVKIPDRFLEPMYKPSGRKPRPEAIRCAYKSGTPAYCSRHFNCHEGWYKRAIEAGWQRIGGAWHCPDCAKGAGRRFDSADRIEGRLEDIATFLREDFYGRYSLETMLEIIEETTADLLTDCSVEAVTEYLKVGVRRFLGSEMLFEFNGQSLKVDLAAPGWANDDETGDVVRYGLDDERRALLKYLRRDLAGLVTLPPEYFSDDEWRD